jgi:NADPH:quinone reductase-like Zn-dependent oxidoreductase
MSRGERTVPERMQALVLTSYDDQGVLEVQERPVPRPRKNEVLVEVAAAAVNPTDLALLIGRRSHEGPLPRVPGAEGSGTVVASGGGALARALVGRRVAFGVPPGQDGSWAQYAVVPMTNCLVLPKGVDDEHGSMSLVNPVTAWVLLDIAQRRGSKAVVSTAAAGALGRMIARLGARRGIGVINVVRRQEQVETLQAEGREHVLDSSEPAFDEQLEERCRQLGARVAFDAVAGDLTARLLRALPSGGHVVIYGALSLEPSSFDPSLAIFESKSISGFYLPAWLAATNTLTALRTIGLRVRPLLGKVLDSTIHRRSTLENAPAAIADYASHMSAGKLLLRPNDRSPSPET